MQKALSNKNLTEIGSENLEEIKSLK